MKLRSSLNHYILVVFTKIVGERVYSKKYLTGDCFGRNGLGWKYVMRCIFHQKILGINKSAKWPVGRLTTVVHPENIVFDPNDLHIFQAKGAYFQAKNARIIFGKGCFVGPNVGIITANHNPLNLKEHLKGEDIRIGDNCWIGMNSVITSGVSLGDNTIVGAGSVVTKSFLEGSCLIAGNPACIIKRY